ncbi:16S rRNA (guanine(527)-N(7))-methyltransferase RsmG [Helicobacter sp. MIT 05-5294]|uniref:16S rRNA (guanine(527)-N(7))-methyltransferase RsmG n=1 Tax=Helicobacter sp. MIT 05-5294 TaxID=1548150 RepID=UPI0010FE1AD8|nr:16S rRNA (guanine(527)-N(7))-methyltransferase RsmG [Helicobacter sp. MIT 05-5294]TLD87853.1 16S rRNA (guanine(527)-N(7))-methyltransferase RsmG [Helicobacter sp. MIT 05-5294]
MRTNPNFPYFTNTLKDSQIALLDSYANLLLRWNAIHSLSGAKDLQSIQKNIQDSLFPLQYEMLNMHIKTNLLDVGSGNGFPSIPLGIALEIPTILCEPNAKKAAFLQNIKANLNLKNFTIKREKVESLELEKKPNLITSRATFGIQEFLEKCQRQIGIETTILLYKGSNFTREIPQGLKYTHFQNGLLHYIAILGKDLKC